jgi:type II secretory pathway component PulK
MLEATGSSVPELPGMAELFVLIPVFLAALMAARALAQAGFNPLRFKGRQLTGETQC